MSNQVRRPSARLVRSVTVGVILGLSALCAPIGALADGTTTLVNQQTTSPGIQTPGASYSLTFDGQGENAVITVGAVSTPPLHVYTAGHDGGTTSGTLLPPLDLVYGGNYQLIVSYATPGQGPCLVGVGSCVIVAPYDPGKLPQTFLTISWCTRVSQYQWACFVGDPAGWCHTAACV